MAITLDDVIELNSPSEKARQVLDAFTPASVNTVLFALNTTPAAAQTAPANNLNTNDAINTITDALNTFGLFA